MNKFVKTVACIAAGLAIGGMVLLSIGKSMGGKTGIFLNISDPKGNILTDEDMVSGTISLEDFNAINIDVASIDVKLCKGSENKVEYYCPEVYVPKVSVENKKLIVKQPSYSGSINYFSTTNKIFEYTVYLTEDNYDVELNSASGSISVNAININGKVNTASGDVFIEKSNSNELEITFASGDIMLTECKYKKAYFNGASGDIFCKDSSFDNITTHTASGETTINNCVCIESSLETSSGDVGGDITSCEAIGVKTASGEINLILAGSVDDYSVKISSSSGDICVDQIEAEKELTFNSNAKKNIVCASASGDITILFK